MPNPIGLVKAIPNAIFRHGFICGVSSSQGRSLTRLVLWAGTVAELYQVQFGKLVFENC